ncbi:MAG: redox-regulated ATPase YchF [Thermoprotei archaeon]|nr:MAG: redox-regulated ATPase YchF [Thermoprotei archaeon]
MLQIGLVGKPNAGKSTFFSAATLVDVKIAPYPFTTIEANKGVGYVKIKCVCSEFNVQDNPVNSKCIRGFRFIPVEIIDVAGLVPDAWKGRGLGNRFLDELRRADVLIHVVDASGGTDEEGRKLRPGQHDPLKDVAFLEKEVDMWIFQILKKDWNTLIKKATILGSELSRILAERLSGLGVKLGHIQQALSESGLEDIKKARDAGDEKILFFVKLLRQYSKPILIAANKCDIPQSEDNIKIMMKELKGKYIVIPTSSISELVLRKAAKAGLIEYLPGESDFKILDEKKLSRKQIDALEYVRENVLKKWGSTGVQESLNRAVFDILETVVVFPVENEYKLTDHHGRVLPDAFLVPPGTTAKEFAGLIHSDLQKKFMHAVDARTKRKLPANYVLKHKDVIKIVTRR